MSTNKITKHQKCLFTKLMKENNNLLEGKFPNSSGKKTKEEIWTDLSKQLNACGPSKSIGQWQKCWNDMKINVRKKFRQLTAESQKTGGGVVDPKFELSSEQLEIFNICGVDYFAGDNETNEAGFGKKTVCVEVPEGASQQQEQQQQQDADDPASFENLPSTSGQQKTPKKRHHQSPQNYVHAAFKEAAETNKLIRELIEAQNRNTAVLEKLVELLTPQYLE